MLGLVIAASRNNRAIPRNHSKPTHENVQIRALNVNLEVINRFVPEQNIQRRKRNGIRGTRKLYRGPAVATVRIHRDRASLGPYRPVN